MSAPKFTPGPWEWTGDTLWGGQKALEEVLSVGDDGKPYGFHSAVLVPHWDGEQAVANARLIAAAPELYEALEAVELACRMGIPPGEVLSLNSTIRLAARAALAKARGEA